jgi:hypothetical protein
VLPLLALAIASVLPLPAWAFDWQPFAEADVVEIVTHDEDGALRETKVWIVVLDESGYVRTNDSRWLANIRRGSDVSLRVGELTQRIHASERAEPALREQVEGAFLEKYGTMQRIMSALRFSEPTVLELAPEPSRTLRLGDQVEPRADGR